MIANGVMDHTEWPSLGSTGKASAAVANTTNTNANEDWELLDPQDEDDDDETPKDDAVLVVDTTLRNSKLLRHSASSPDLRRFVLSDVPEDDDESDVASDSFAMVPGPASVISVASSGLSFKDAMLASKGPAVTTTTAATTTHSKKKKDRIRPRFVVTPIKRCAKSTGDLQSLSKIEEDEDEEILGDSDAVEFYNRKAQGSKGRVNGQRLRPDEAKRKQMIVYKKDLQRQQQQRR